MSCGSGAVENGGLFELEQKREAVVAVFGDDPNHRDERLEGEPPCSPRRSTRRFAPSGTLLARRRRRSEADCDTTQKKQTRGVSQGLKGRSPGSSPYGDA